MYSHEKHVKYKNEIVTILLPLPMLIICLLTVLSFILLYHAGHDDRVRRKSDGTFGNRRRVSFKPQGRSGREISRSLTLALDDDIPLAGSSNNNNRQVIVRGRNRGLSRGRNSPLPHRALRSGSLSTSQSLPAGETSWYKITVNILS